VKGKAWKFASNINTDLIIAGRYLNTTDPAELACHCLEDLDPEFLTKISPGDLIVAGENFGCGSSREHAPIAIKAAGIACVIAESFARIFFRNAINIGLPIFECPDAARGISQGDEVEVDMAKGTITDLTTGASYSVPPWPQELQAIIAAGGLMNYVTQELRKK
jgi:3-isopropylmalate dehydratase small subunit